MDCIENGFNVRHIDETPFLAGNAQFNFALAGGFQAAIGGDFGPPPFLVFQKPDVTLNDANHGELTPAVLRKIAILAQLADALGGHHD